MYRFVYPAAFYRDSNECVAFFPDLDLYATADSMEEVMLSAKEQLKVFCLYCFQLGDIIVRPSRYEQIEKENPKAVIMLIDCEISDMEAKKMKRLASV